MGSFPLLITMHNAAMNKEAQVSGSLIPIILSIYPEIAGYTSEIAGSDGNSVFNSLEELPSYCFPKTLNLFKPSWQTYEMGHGLDQRSLTSLIF